MATKPSLVAKFRTVAGERLGRLSHAILELEEGRGGAELAEEAMREIHTLKGEARMLGLAKMAEVAHRTEDAMIAAKARGFEPGVPLLDAALAGLDLFERLLEGGVADETTDGLVAEFSAEVERLSTKPEAVKPAATPAREERGSSPDGGAIRMRRTDTLPVPIARIDELTRLLNDVLQLRTQRERHVRGLLRTVRAARETLRESQSLLRRVDGGALSSEERGTLVRIHERLMDLTAIHADVEHLVGRVREDDFTESLFVGESAERLREIRMVPLASLFEAYPRAVRDLARTLGKRVRLEVHGAAVRIDAAVLEQLGEPILHLVRNAIDHGIEDATAREAAGKPAEGTLAMHASQAGSRLKLVVADDGRGFDPDAIRQAAVRRGLMGAEAAAGLSRAAAFDLTFAPGFSTREGVSDVSGRGVGLDVVRRRIEALGGAVRLESEPGKGSRFLFDVPLSAAVLDVLLVRDGECNFAIPSAAIDAVIDPTEGEVDAAPAGHVLRWQEQVLPLADLGVVLGDGAGEEGEGRIVLLVHQGRKLALRVAQVKGERSLVQREVPALVADPGAVGGTATLGEGEPVLILNVAGLFDAAGRGAGPSRRPSKPAASSVGRVLVAEDSEITRVLLVEILRGIGLRVAEAGDGRQALEVVAGELPDLILTDLDMPVMDGFELLERVRADARTRSVPVIVFSARGAEADRARAAELGADAYLVKSRFRETDLVETVRRYLPAASFGRARR